MLYHSTWLYSQRTWQLRAAPRYRPSPFQPLLSAACLSVLLWIRGYLSVLFTPSCPRGEEGHTKGGPSAWFQEPGAGSWTEPPHNSWIQERVLFLNVTTNSFISRISWSLVEFLHKKALKKCLFLRHFTTFSSLYRFVWGFFFKFTTPNITQRHSLTSRRVNSTLLKKHARLVGSLAGVFW